MWVQLEEEPVKLQESLLPTPGRGLMGAVVNPGSG